MTSKTTTKFSHEVRTRAVRMMLDPEGDHAPRWAAMVSLAEKTGCPAQTLNEWMKKVEVDAGKRAVASTETVTCPGFFPRRGARAVFARAGSLGSPMGSAI